MARFCPTHKKELKHFEGISKKTGNPYENYKCTARDNGVFCSYVEWVDVAPTSPKTAPGRTEAPQANTEHQFMIDTLERIEENVVKILDIVQPRD